MNSKWRLYVSLKGSVNFLDIRYS